MKVSFFKNYLLHVNKSSFFLRFFAENGLFQGYFPLPPILYIMNTAKEKKKSIILLKHNKSDFTQGEELSGQV